MIGIRCSSVTYLVRYALHFPEERFYWINFIGAIGVGLFFMAFETTSKNGYAFMALYLVAIMLAYYRKTESRDTEVVEKEKEEDKEIRE